MNWSDFEGAWKRQEPPAGAGADLAGLRATFEAQSRKLRAGLLVRDLSEAGTGIFLAAVAGLQGWRLGREGWPAAIAVALLLGLSAFFIRERIRTRRRRLGPGAPLLAKLEADIAELRHQRRLLLSLGRWYLAPVGVAWAIMVAVNLQNASRHAPPGFLADLMRDPATAGFIVLYFAVIVPLIGWGAWAANRRAVRRRIEPRMEELEKMRHDLRPPE